MTATLQQTPPDQTAPAEPGRTALAHTPADIPRQGAVEAVHAHAPAVPVDPHAAARVVLAGALTARDGAAIVRLVEDAPAGAGVVQVDLSEVSRIDGAVARALLRASWRLEGSGRRLVLASPSRQVRRVLYWYAAEHLVPREHRSARRSRRRQRRPPWES